MTKEKKDEQIDHKKICKNILKCMILLKKTFKTSQKSLWTYKNAKKATDILQLRNMWDVKVDGINHDKLQSLQKVQSCLKITLLRIKFRFVVNWAVESKGVV